MKRFELQGPVPFLWVGLLFIVLSCSRESDSSLKLAHKPPPKTGIIANVTGQEILEQEMLQGIKIQVYDLEKKLYDLKYNQLKALIIKKLIPQGTKGKGQSPDEYLEQEIFGKLSPSKKQIDDFVKERNIPKEHLNEQLKKRIKTFLMVQLKEKEADRWLAKQSKKKKIEIYLSRPERPFFEVEIGEAPVMGDRQAKVTILEFSDFECPYCRKGATMMKKIKKKFGKKVSVAFKHFPLPFHRKAKGAAHASMCVHEQDKEAFWKFHDLMFENQSSLDEDGLVKLAKKLKLEMKKFKECMDTKKYAEYVEKNIAEGKKVGVKSTPTFFINGRIVNGVQPLEVFEEEIRSHL